MTATKLRLVGGMVLEEEPPIPLAVNMQVLSLLARVMRWERTDGPAAWHTYEFSNAESARFEAASRHIWAKGAEGVLTGLKNSHALFTHNRDGENNNIRRISLPSRLPERWSERASYMNALACIAFALTDDATYPNPFYKNKFSARNKSTCRKDKGSNTSPVAHILPPPAEEIDRQRSAYARINDVLQRIDELRARNVRLRRELAGLKTDLAIELAEVKKLVKSTV